MIDLTLNENRTSIFPRGTWAQAKLNWIVLAIWGLGLATLSVPGRGALEQTGGTDIVSLVKLAIRLFVLVSGFYLVHRELSDSNASRSLKVFRGITVFVAWCSLSVLWSPEKSISVSQLMGLVALILIACLVTVTARTGLQRDRLLWHLNLLLICLDLFILAVHAVRPDLSGLNRRMLLDGMPGFVHPTAAGATGSLGLTLLLICWLNRTGHISTWIAFIGFPAHALMLLVANSRSALGMAVLACGIAIVWMGTARLRGVLFVMTGFSALLVLLVDPGLVRIERVLHVSTDFVSRGQSSTELAAGSGRMELWTAIAAEYEKAPLIGHGYFMTSSTGYLDVWGGRIMRDAHNFLLQVVASTGLVGLTIFAVASVAIAAHYRNLWRGDADARMWARISLLLFVWYVGWGLGCTTFMGPLRPDSLAFYLLLGLGLAEAQRVMASRSAQSQLTETRTAPEQWRMA